MELMVLTAALWATLAHPANSASNPSPFEVHELLRSRVFGGQDATPLVLQWVAQTGDHSFDGLIGSSEAKKRGLRLQLDALRFWDEGDLARAQNLYRRAAGLMSRSGAATEAAFCLYYSAEILAQQDRHRDSLDRLREAEKLARREGTAKPYLEALILQSRGYGLWVMDQLHGSVAAFGLAQERWGRLGVPHGQAMSWNNLAGLYEDMGLRRKADRAYRQAVESAGPDVFPEIRFQVFANYAFFLHQNGEREDSLKWFDQAQLLREAAPFEFLLLRCRLFADADSLRELEGWVPASAMEEIERLLLLAENAGGRRAERLYRQALLLSGVGSQRRMARLAALQAGKWLESRGRFADAAGVYLEAFRKQEYLRRPEMIFPYSLAASRLLDGWIRCLIALGEPDFALRQIREYGEERRNRAVRFLAGLSEELLSVGEIARTTDGLEPFVEAARLEAQGHFASGPGRTTRTADAIRPAGFCIVHMWPDGERVYAWIENSAGTHFRILKTQQPMAQLLSESVGALYQAGDFLPPVDRGLLRQLHRQLLAPIRPLLDRDQIVFVGHKQLQFLPIEALIDDSGRWLLLDFSVSYLPSSRAGFAEVPRSAPVVLTPRLRNALGGAADEERFFETLFPEARFVRGVSQPIPERARWIHVSSHFTLDADLWMGSTFQGAPERLSATRFLTRRFSCGLLSLGVCDAGNAYGWASPYWLNLGELLLSRQVGALVINRWKMDESTSEIFIDFFRRCRRGVSMDRALTEARRRFIQRPLRRDGAEVSAEHPFFWAGVSYVGVPGKTLYDPKPATGSLPSLLFGAFAVFLAVVWAFAFAARRGKEDAWHDYG